MAALETTVMSPNGPVMSFNDRVPVNLAKDQAREHLQRSILRMQDQLNEFDNWWTETHRGATKARSYEEMQSHG